MEPIIHDGPGSGPVCPKTEQKRAVQRRTRVPRPTLSLDPAVRAQQVWEEFTRWHTPRGRVRCDVLNEDGTWAHRYDDEVPVTAHPPQAPFAVYLANEHGQFQFIVFDLDTKRAENGAEQVRQDATYLAKQLDTAGLAYLVIASGSPNGLHLWVPVNDARAAGAPASLVARIAYAAAHKCPTVDKSPLLNPRTGCVRPPGAPHRAGGYSQLLTPHDPVVASAYADATANTLKRLEKLAELLGHGLNHEHPDTTVDTDRIVDTTAARLVGRPRPMPTAIAELLAQPPQSDASAHLARILTGLALARWSLAEVLQEFCTRPHAPGWEHIRTQATDFGRRRRSPATQRAILERQWHRQVAYAARLPRRKRHTQDTPQVRALVETVWSIEQVSATIAPFGHWWRTQSGASDRRAIHYVAQMALEGLTDTVEVDGRRLADATGMAHSTAARALARLVLDGRLILVEEGEGRRAHTYRLLPSFEWPVQQVREMPTTQGGTQATPRLADRSLVPSREQLLARMRERSEHAAHDVWASLRSGGSSGLGRHVEITAFALKQGQQQNHPYGVDFLVQRTGYSRRTIVCHLHILTSFGLVSKVQTARPPRIHPELYHRVARILGVAGTRARRMAGYEVERRVWAWWVSEVQRLRAPRKVVGQPPTRWSKKPYPRTRNGRPDHAAARSQALTTV
ncbi:hypothetical protein [Nocardiopsis synnemataformans]|uniref:non-homologous end-joining DNA ligase LigD n=1 Tax=Nocardiopsis synnemataformans TaxID=61305 RepID=UPI003EBC90AA